MKYLLIFLLFLTSCHNRTLTYEENYIEQEGAKQYNRIIIVVDTIK